MIDGFYRFLARCHYQYIRLPGLSSGFLLPNVTSATSHLPLVAMAGVPPAVTAASSSHSLLESAVESFSMEPALLDKMGLDDHELRSTLTELVHAIQKDRGRIEHLEAKLRNLAHNVQGDSLDHTQHESAVKIQSVRRGSQARVHLKERGLTMDRDESKSSKSKPATAAATATPAMGLGAASVSLSLSQGVPSKSSLKGLRRFRSSARSIIQVNRVVGNSVSKCEVPRDANQ